MFDIIESLINFTADSGYNTNINQYIAQCCSALIILFFVFLMSFIFEFITRIFR